MTYNIWCLEQNRREWR